jgi:hypothetical protein
MTNDLEVIIRYNNASFMLGEAFKMPNNSQLVRDIVLEYKSASDELRATGYVYKEMGQK